MPEPIPFTGAPVPPRPPGPPGPGAMPDPVPTGQNTLPPAVMGPLDPWMAPQGPPGGMELPANLPNAFVEDYPGHYVFYTHAGAMALKRQKLGHTPIALINPGVPAGALKGGSADDDDELIPLDTGDFVRPIGTAEKALDFNQVRPNMAWGYRAHGVEIDNTAVEITGFYLPEDETVIGVVDPSRLDLLFVNFPLGFEGNNGLFLQADSVTVTYQQTMYDLELNYKMWDRIFDGIQLVVGLRLPRPAGADFDLRR